jgi:hypothetical protein
MFCCWCGDLRIETPSGRTWCSDLAILIVCDEHAGSGDNSIAHWLVDSEEPIAEAKTAHNAAVTSLAWHPMGHLLCSVGVDAALRFWTRERPGDLLRGNLATGTLAHNEQVEPMPPGVLASAQDLARTAIPGLGALHNRGPGSPGPERPRPPPVRPPTMGAPAVHQSAGAAPWPQQPWPPAPANLRPNQGFPNQRPVPPGPGMGARKQGSVAVPSSGMEPWMPGNGAGGRDYGRGRFMGGGRCGFKRSHRATEQPCASGDVAAALL